VVESTQGLGRLEGLGKLKKFNYVIENRTRDLPACSIVPPRYSEVLRISQAVLAVAGTVSRPSKSFPIHQSSIARALNSVRSG
jgi:hypothetical protein